MGIQLPSHYAPGVYDTKKTRVQRDYQSPQHRRQCANCLNQMVKLDGIQCRFDGRPVEAGGICEEHQRA